MWYAVNHICASYTVNHIRTSYTVKSYVNIICEHNKTDVHLKSHVSITGIFHMWFMLQIICEHHIRTSRQRKVTYNHMWTSHVYHSKSHMIIIYQNHIRTSYTRKSYVNIICEHHNLKTHIKSHVSIICDN